MHHSSLAESNSASQCENGLLQHLLHVFACPFEVVMEELKVN